MRWKHLGLKQLKEQVKVTQGRTFKFLSGPLAYQPCLFLCLLMLSEIIIEGDLFFRLLCSLISDRFVVVVRFQYIKEWFRIGEGGWLIKKKKTRNFACLVARELLIMCSFSEKNHWLALLASEVDSFQRMSFYASC